jgi:hypothetical protein
MKRLLLATGLVSVLHQPAVAAPLILVADSSAICADGTTQPFSEGPPFCAGHGGVRGARSTAQQPSSYRPSTGNKGVQCADGSLVSLNSGPPYCATSGGIVGYSGSVASSIPWDKVIIGAVVIATAVAVYKAGGAQGYSGAGADYSWDWDAFVDANGRPTWACRGIQTGRFADSYRCAGRLQVDTTWPGPY